MGQRSEPAGHWLHLEAADRVNQCLERWLYWAGRPGP